MYLYNTFGNVSTTLSIVLLLTTGAFVNGPYALITTAVSADLGTHPSMIFFNCDNRTYEYRSHFGMTRHRHI